MEIQTCPKCKHDLYAFMPYSQCCNCGNFLGFDEEYREPTPQEAKQMKMLELKAKLFFVGLIFSVIALPICFAMMGGLFVQSENRIEKLMGLCLIGLAIIYASKLFKCLTK